MSGVPKLGLSVEEAADALGVGRTVIFALIKTGELESVKIGKRRVVPVKALERYFERLLAEQSGRETANP